MKIDTYLLKFVSGAEGSTIATTGTTAPPLLAAATAATMGMGSPRDYNKSPKTGH